MICPPILPNFDAPADREGRPFPYMTSGSVFPEPLATHLVREFPAQSAFARPGVYANENRYDYNLSHILESASPPVVSATWMGVIEYLTSDAFFTALCQAFGVDRARFERLVPRYLENATDIVGTGRSSDDDVLVDFQFCYNVPNAAPCSSFLRRPHVDSPDKLFVMLVYFPVSPQEHYSEKDRGELLIYRTSAPFTEQYMPFKDMKKHLRVVDRVPYRLNHGVVFLNGDTAVHAPMSLVNHPLEHRRFINVVFVSKRGALFSTSSKVLRTEA